MVLAGQRAVRGRLPRGLGVNDQRDCTNQRNRPGSQRLIGALAAQSGQNLIGHCKVPMLGNNAPARCNLLFKSGQWYFQTIGKKSGTEDRRINDSSGHFLPSFVHSISSSFVVRIPSACCAARISASLANASSVRRLRSCSSGRAGVIRAAGLPCRVMTSSSPRSTAATSSLAWSLNSEMWMWRVMPRSVLAKNYFKLARMSITRSGTRW